MFFGGLHNVIFGCCRAIRDSAFIERYTCEDCQERKSYMKEKEDYLDFEHNNWYKLGHDKDESTKLSPYEDNFDTFMELFEENCVRLMSIHEISKNIEGLPKSILKLTLALSKEGRLNKDSKKPLITSAREYCSKLKRNINDVKANFIEAMAYQLIHIQSKPMLDSIYSYNKSEDNLKISDIWKSISKCFKKASRTLDQDTYLDGFVLYVQKIIDKFMHNMLTEPNNGVMYSVSEQQILEDDYKFFVEFFKSDGFDIGEKKRKWFETLKLMRLSSNDLIRKSENFAAEQRKSQMKQRINMISASNV
eukprot:UN31738